MSGFIPYGRQSIFDDDIDAVMETLRSDFITTGPKVEDFENAMAEYLGTNHAVAVSNGTAALHLASLALLEPKTKVLTTPNTFLATSNSIIYAGAKPLFVDIEEDGNIDLKLCEEMLKKDPEIKALYAVHFSGKPVDQEYLSYLKNRFDIIVVEDCAHSLGATTKSGKKAGGCECSDASTFSFHPVKNMTSAEGGLIATNDRNLCEKLKSLRNHGVVRRPDMAPWEYEMQDLGFNYRINDLQCALGLSQLGKLDSFIARRHELARRYDTAFENDDLIEPLYPFDKHSSYHLYVVLIDFERTSIDRSALFHAMRSKGIGLQVHYIPIVLQPYYKRLGYEEKKLPKAMRYYERAVSLPIYAALTDEKQMFVIDTLKEIVHG